MSVKILMISSALFMALLGLAALFGPVEILVHLKGQPSSAGVLLVQALGGLYLGMAAMNWAARRAILGGIYGRPIILANMIHFSVFAVTLARALIDGESYRWLWLLIPYVLFAAWFGLTLFRYPSKQAGSEIAGQ